MSHKSWPVEKLSNPKGIKKNNVQGGFHIIVGPFLFPTTERCTSSNCSGEYGFLPASSRRAEPQYSRKSPTNFSCVGSDCCDAILCPLRHNQNTKIKNVNVSPMYSAVLER